MIALDAATGKEIWTFTPETAGFQPVRGVTYWQDGKEQRLFTSASNYIYAIDAATGKSVSNFGATGRIDLREGLGSEPERHGENRYTNSLLALDAATGRLVWHFQTVHHDL